MRLVVLAIAFGFSLSACVGDPSYPDPDDDGISDDTDDDGTGDDSGDDELPGDDLPPGDDDDPGACPSANMGSVPSLNEAQAGSEAADPNQPDGPKVHYVFGNIDAETIFEVGLWDGYGAFADGAASPGTYEISGDEADPQSCGVCVFLAVGERVFFATSGSVTVDSIAGTFSGDASSLMLEEVSEEAGGFVPNGCTASLSAVTFSATMQ